MRSLLECARPNTPNRKRPWLRRRTPKRLRWVDPARWSLGVNEKPWVACGGVEQLSAAEAHREIAPSSIDVELKLGLGKAEATGWGCDLSRDYVRVNANYRT